MLRALDDLEKAVSRLMGKAGEKAPDSSISKRNGASIGQAATSRAAGQPDKINEEAAELIRRAIKRLKSL